MIYITVTDPAGRDIYLNRSYDEAVGTIPLTIPLESGPTLFETLTGGRAVDYRGRIGHVDDGAVATIALEPVVPPQNV